MNNNLNMSGLGFQNSVNSLELEQAKRRMGTSSTNALNMGMTSSTMSGTSMTSFSSVPSLTNSTSTGLSEIQKAKQQMNRFS